MRRASLIRAVLLLCFFGGALTGCATAPKPRSFGQAIGSGIDNSITWASKGIQKLLNK